MFCEVDFPDFFRLKLSKNNQSVSVLFIITLREIMIGFGQG